MELKELINFIKITHHFQQLKRTVFATGENRMENDSEHSFQLALVGWYLVSSQKLKLNPDKVLKYGLVHDLVEIYSGDVDFFKQSAKISQLKKKREEKAVKKLKRNFSEFADLHKSIHTYEQKKDKESKFIYALDKILPMINIYLDSGKTWKMKKITLKTLINGKNDKVAVDAKIHAYFKDLVKILQRKERSLFANR